MIQLRASTSFHSHNHSIISHNLYSFPSFRNESLISKEFIWSQAIQDGCSSQIRSWWFLWCVFSSTYEAQKCSRTFQKCMFEVCTSGSLSQILWYCHRSLCFTKLHITLMYMELWGPLFLTFCSKLI